MPPRRVVVDRRLTVADAAGGTRVKADLGDADIAGPAAELTVRLKVARGFAR
jgi:hypothetical protein